MKKKGIVWCLVFALLLSILPVWNEKETYQAATSYDNAMEFFHSTDNGDGKHIEVVDGTIYFGTRAKLAKTRSGHKYYNTLGYDVTLTGNGHSVTFAVKRGGSLEEVPDSVRVDSSGYEYLLYRIPTNTIFYLASKADPVNAKEVLKASVIDVRMDAIVTIRQNGVQGNVVEDGKGGLTETAPVYHLKNSSHLNVMRNEFSGHLFETYIKILGKLYNYELSVIYAVNGTPEHIAGASTTVTMGSGYKRTTAVIDGVTVPYVLCTDSGPVKSSSRVVNEITILMPSDVSMNKEGYHLETGQEWITDSKTQVSANTQMSKEVAPDIGYGDRVLVLYANWKANTYQVVYNANKGTGAMSPTTISYDSDGILRKNIFTRTGYTFLGWSTNPNATSAQYTDQQSVRNLTAANGGQITLYAVWQPCVYEIITNLGEGSGGTDAFYEKYEHGFYSDENTADSISTILIPTLRGHTFTGYHMGMYGGRLVVNADGSIAVENTFFKQNTMIYASYEANKYEVSYDMQGGSDGSTLCTATFGQLFPIAKAPNRDGYSFQGYYTEEKGMGECIYNRFMATDTVYDYVQNITLYAHWLDDVAPELTFTADYDTWTNQKITLTAKAQDEGSGLKSLLIYQVNGDGTERLVAQKNGTGETESAVQYTNETEGITRYRAVTEDMEGNTAESYCVAYYDIVAPDGTVVEKDDSFGKLTFELDITDIDTGN